MSLLRGGATPLACHGVRPCMPPFRRWMRAKSLSCDFVLRLGGQPRTRFRQLADELDGKADKALDALENGLEDAMAVMVLPEKYRRRLATTTMQERLNEEICRRERVIRIFPNEASAMRLIGALLAEKHETWSTGRKYFDMLEYFEWKAEQPQKADAKVRSIK